MRCSMCGLKCQRKFWYDSHCFCSESCRKDWRLHWEYWDSQEKRRKPWTTPLRRVKNVVCAIIPNGIYRGITTICVLTGVWKTSKKTIRNS